MQDAKCRFLVRAIRAEIANGKYSEGRPLPSLRALSKRFDCSVSTVQRALDELFHCGIVSRRQGSGTFVTCRASSRKIGLIVPGVARSEFFPPIVSEISRLVRLRGQFLVYGDVCVEDRKPRERELKNVVDEFLSAGVDGVVFQPFDDEYMALSRKIVQCFRERSVPVVLLNRDVETFPRRSACDCVGIDNLAAGYEVGLHLKDMNAKRVAFVSRPAIGSVRDRLRGLELCAKERGLVVRDFDFDERDVKSLKKCLSSFRPRAIVCGNDETAVRISQGLGKLNVAVPEAVMLVGFDDVRYATAMTPQLTTIRQPCAEIAAAAIERLAVRIANPNLAPVDLKLPAKLIIRESTGRCRNRNIPKKGKQQ